MSHLLNIVDCRLFGLAVGYGAPRLLAKNAQSGVERGRELAEVARMGSTIPAACGWPSEFRTRETTQRPSPADRSA